MSSSVNVRLLQKLIGCDDLLTDFANSEPVPGFDDGVLQMSFTEIRQLLDLILTWDWTSYFADYATPKSKYLRVNPAIALSLFEKYVFRCRHQLMN